VVGSLAALAFLSAVACGGDSAPSGGAGQAVEGAAAYAASCAGCHGAELQGTDRGPSLLSIVYEPGHHPDMAFRSAIATGAPQHHWSFGNMPAVPGLSDAEIDAVVAFVRARQDELGFEPYPPR
jgi:mono/diheme cytochrome c family protein